MTTGWDDDKGVKTLEYRVGECEEFIGGLEYRMREIEEFVSELKTQLDLETATGPMLSAVGFVLYSVRRDDPDETDVDYRERVKRIAEKTGIGV